MFALSASSVGFFFSRLLSRSERFKPGLEHFLINNCVALCSLDVFAKNIGAFSSQIPLLWGVAGGKPLGGDPRRLVLALTF